MRRRLVTGLLVFALVGLVACEEAEPAPRAPATGEPSAQSTPTSVPRALDLVETDVVTRPQAYRRQSSNLPATFPGRDEQFASPLAEPPGVTVLTYRPYEGLLATGRELVGEPAGWSGETVFFWSGAGEWRRLDLTELGLPESEHPGDDTYGVGRLSPDGLHWSASSRGGFVVVDLVTGSVRSKRLEVGQSVRYLRWLDGARLQAVGTARRGRQVVWEYDVTDDVLEPRAWPAPWSVWPDPDGTPVLFAGSGRSGARRTSWPEQSSDPVREELPFRHRVSGWPLYGPSNYLLATWKDPGYDLLAVDGSTDEPLRALRVTNLGYHWWAGDRVVFAVAEHLLVWDPASGELRRLTSAPAMPRGLTEQQRGLLWWHADLAGDTVSFG